jgi:hypothetical protein
MINRLSKCHLHALPALSCQAGPPWRWSMVHNQFNIGGDDEYTEAEQEA